MTNPEPLPRVNVREEIPSDSQHPGSHTGRIRAHLLTDPGELMTQRIRQLEYHQRLEEADPQPRN